MAYLRAWFSAARTLEHAPLLAVKKQYRAVPLKFIPNENRPPGSASRGAAFFTH